MRKQIYYLATWRRIRASRLNTDPLCEFCKLDGIIKEADTVDHLISFYDRDDWLAFEYNNTQSLCVACHDHMSKYEAHIQKRLRDECGYGPLALSGDTGLFTEEIRQRMIADKYRLFLDYRRRQVGADGYPRNYSK